MGRVELLGKTPSQGRGALPLSHFRPALQWTVDLGLMRCAGQLLDYAEEGTIPEDGSPGRQEEAKLHGATTVTGARVWGWDGDRLQMRMRELLGDINTLTLDGWR